MKKIYVYKNKNIEIEFEDKQDALYFICEKANISFEFASTREEIELQNEIEEIIVEKYFTILEVSEYELVQ